jgi:ABC-type branched-subunit amino acid transport system permease subunit
MRSVRWRFRGRSSTGSRGVRAEVDARSGSRAPRSRGARRRRVRLSAVMAMAALVGIAGATVAPPSGAAPPPASTTGTVVTKASSPNGEVLVAGSGAH